MRMFSRGLLELDMCASISYRSNTSSVNALLNGCSRDQQNDVHRFLERCKSLAGHPLLLPVIFIGMKRNLIGTEERNQWNKLSGIENSIDQIRPRDQKYLLLGRQLSTSTDSRGIPDRHGTNFIRTP